jgi:hypothetical protein
MQTLILSISILKMLIKNNYYCFSTIRYFENNLSPIRLVDRSVHCILRSLHIREIFTMMCTVLENTQESSFDHFDLLAMLCSNHHTSIGGTDGTRHKAPGKTTYNKLSFFFFHTRKFKIHS